MKFSLKNLFKKKNLNKIDDELMLEDNDLDLDLDELENEDEFIINNKSKLNLSKIFKNKKILITFPIIILIAGGGYYYYLMKSNDINLSNLKEPMPKMKKIINKPIIKRTTLNNHLSKMNNSKHIVKKNTKNEDIFNSIMKNSKTKTNKQKIINNSKNNTTIITKNKPKLNIKKENLISKVIKKKNQKSINDKMVIKTLQKDETLLKNEYLPILTSNDKKNKKDVYALTAEELLKLKDMDKYINEKEKYMERVTKFLIKKQKYMTALENFDEFNKEMRNKQKTDNEKKLKDELNKKIKNIEFLLNQKMKDLNKNIQKLNNNEKNKNSQNKDLNIQNIKKNEKIVKNNISEFFKGGQIFIMNNEYIIAVNHNGMETIYKKGEKVLDNFTITNITDSIITLEKNNKLYFYNLKTNLGTKEFTRVIIQMPLMVDNSKKESSFNKKLNNTNKIKKYLTPTERKKQEAQKFFNSTK